MSLLVAPDGLSYLDFQHDSILYALQRKKTLIADQPGLGKGHPLTTRIATPKGFIPLGQLSAGDQVLGASGKPVEILKVHERGILPVYRVSTNDGGSVLCDAEHLWTVYDEELDDWITIDTIELAARCNYKRLPIPLRVHPAEFAARAFDIPPMEAGIALSKPETYSEQRTIEPSQYENASPSQRMAFLSGVIRTLGRVRGDDSHFRVLIKEPLKTAQFSDTVIAVVRSLGGMVKVHRSHLRWRLDIYLPDEIWRPIVGYNRPSKKMNRRWKGFQPGVPPRFITGVTPQGRDHVRCLSVDAPDNLYVTEDFLVTHNTVSAIGASNNLGRPVTSMLVICLASHKEHWKRAVELWDMHGLSVGIAEGDFLPDTECVVINYDILHRHYDALRAGTWDILICDEAHVLQNEFSRRTLNVFGGKVRDYIDPDEPQKGKMWYKYEPILADREFYLTGTPIPNRVKNLWTLIKRIDPNGLGRNYDAFANRYCGAYTDNYGKTNDNGASNLDELRKLLRDRFMVRHLKADVLKDLPPKVRQVIPLDSAGLQKKIKAEKDAVAELLRAYEAHVGSHIDLDDVDLAALVMRAKPQMFDDYAKTVDDDIGRDTPLNKLAIARAELALEKVPMIIEYVSNLMDQGEKVVVFAYHRAVIDALKARWSNSCALIYGGTPVKKRQAEADRFQEDPNCNPFIGQYTAAGTGYTLTVATHVVCCELTWLPHELSQAEDRCHRIGQHDVVNVHHLVVVGSMDDGMLGKIIAKQEIIDQALDGPVN